MLAAAVRTKTLLFLSIGEKCCLKPGTLSARPRSKEPAVPFKAIVQGREDPTLERLAEVDEYVPAGHEVELRERWVPGEIVPDEDAQLPDVLLMRYPTRP